MLHSMPIMVCYATEEILCILGVDKLELDFNSLLQKPAPGRMRLWHELFFFFSYRIKNASMN